MSELDSILAKIKKLLNLTVDRGATPDEAASAAAKAQALLFEHNLSMSQVNTHELPNGKAEEIENIEMEIEGGSGAIRWKRSLLHAIARHNFCRAVSLTGTSDVSVIGKRSNVVVVEYMSEYLEKEISRLATNAAKDIVGSKVSFVSSFSIGAVVTIAERLKRQEEESGRANAASTALVVQTKDALDKALKRFFPHTRMSRGSRISHAEGFEAGKKAGRSIGLHKAVRHGASAQAQLY